MSLSIELLSYLYITLPAFLSEKNISFSPSYLSRCFPIAAPLPPYFLFSSPSPTDLPSLILLYHFSTSFSLHIPELSPPFLFLHIIFSVFSVFLSRINRALGKAAEREAITSLPRQSPRRFGSLFIGLLSLDLAACHQSQCIRS